MNRIGHTACIAVDFAVVLFDGVPYGLWTGEVKAWNGIEDEVFFRKAPCFANFFGIGIAERFVERLVVVVAVPVQVELVIC